MATPRLEAQPRIFVTALGAPGQGGTGRCGIKRIASNAVKCRPAPLRFKAPVVAPVVPEPQPEKDQADQRTVDDGSGREVEHPTALWPSSPRRQDRPAGRYFQMCGLKRTRFRSRRVR